MTNFLKHKMRGKSPGAIVGWVILGGLGIAAMAILFGFVIMWLWNLLMPAIFGLAVITYWQAVGLFILSKILFGHGSRGCNGKGQKSKKWGNGKCVENSDKKEFSKWKQYDQYWKEEGDQSYKNYVERMNNKTNTDTVTPEENNH
tara:strand:+ start:217 stop:651 length:435 start_codon:yes stop_codon:yes gene_type:complete